MKLNHIYHGHALDILRTFPDNSIHCCITSPPYWNLRDYGVAPTLWQDGHLECLGREGSITRYMAHLVEIFEEVRRVLRPDGTFWLNLGDTYSKGIPQDEGIRARNLCGIPWRVAFVLQSYGWDLHSDIIWHKLNPLPESIKTRPSRAHEYLFFFTKSSKYFYDCDAIREPYRTSSLKRLQRAVGLKNKYAPQNLKDLKSQPINTPRSGMDANDIQKAIAEKRTVLHPLGKNKTSVWPLAVNAKKTTHYAPFPEKLVEPCVLAGCPEGGIVLDPFSGSGTTARVAKRLNRSYIGIELNPTYITAV